MDNRPGRDRKRFARSWLDWLNLTSAIHEHKAGVRPTMKDYEPVVGCHPDHPDVFVINGLGSKGVLRAPTIATELLSLIDGKVVSPNHDYRRQAKKNVLAHNDH